MKVIKTVSQSKQFRGIQSSKSIRQVVSTNRSATHLAKSNKSLSQTHRKFSTTHGSQKKEIIDRIIRVDHAGEYGAQRIYEGQMAVFKGTPLEPVIKKMQEQETFHLKTFENLVTERRVRPTVLNPLWSMVGYGLGYGSALMGKEAAMALTVAVEEVIGEHYNDQLRIMNEEGYTQSEEDIKLKKHLKEFRDDELEHLDTGLQHNAEQAPMYQLFTSVIKAGAKAAIWVSERV